MRVVRAERELVVPEAPQQGTIDSSDAVRIAALEKVDQGFPVAEQIEIPPTEQEIATQETYESVYGVPQESLGGDFHGPARFDGPTHADIYGAPPSDGASAADIYGAPQTGGAGAADIYGAPTESAADESDQVVPGAVSDDPPATVPDTTAEVADDRAPPGDTGGERPAAPRFAAAEAPAAPRFEAGPPAPAADGAEAGGRVEAAGDTTNPGYDPRFYYMRDGQPIRHDRNAVHDDGSPVVKLSSERDADGNFIPAADAPAIRAEFTGAPTEVRFTGDDAVISGIDTKTAEADTALAAAERGSDDASAAHRARTDAGEERGHIAADRMIADRYPPGGTETAVRLDEPANFAEPRDGKGNFDQIYEITKQDGTKEILVIECKGGQGELGSRLIPGTNDRAEQGTPQYLEATIRDMSHRDSTQDLALRLEEARVLGNIRYELVRATTDDRAFVGYQNHEFDLTSPQQGTR